MSTDTLMGIKEVAAYLKINQATPITGPRRAVCRESRAGALAVSEGGYRYVAR
jgi:hypothetical protein